MRDTQVGREDLARLFNAALDEAIDAVKSVDDSEWFKNQSMMGNAIIEKIREMKDNGKHTP